MVGKDITDKDIARGLRADGLSTLIGAFLNTFPYCAYNANVGLVAISGVKSRWVVATSGGFLVLLGLFPKVAAVFALLPLPVLGGVSLAMFSMIAVTGIRLLSKVDFSRGQNALIVATSVGLGLITVAVPDFYQHLNPTLRIFLHSWITTGCLTAIALNAWLNRRGASQGEAATFVV